jgi:hypothetical protein
MVETDTANTPTQHADHIATNSGPVDRIGSSTAARTDGTGSAAVQWEVTISAHMGRVICRTVTRDGSDYRRDDVIWPTWIPAQGNEENEKQATPGVALNDAQDYWSSAGARIRDSAKWSATVVGAGLAAVVGTSPLSTMRSEPPQKTAVVLGAVGLFLLVTVIFFVLSVLRPQSTSFEDLQKELGRWNPLRRWKETVESQEDLYLPLGVVDLTGLRREMIVEELTLNALAYAIHVTCSNQELGETLHQAQQARATRLEELHASASMVTTIGEFYRLRRRSKVTTWIGCICGAIGVAAIVAAFAWPPAERMDRLEQRKITLTAEEARLHAAELGVGCRSFTAIVLDENDAAITALVRPNDRCSPAQVQLSKAGLVIPSLRGPAALGQS